MSKRHLCIHPSPDDCIWMKLAKIVENPIQLDKTLVLKTTFPVAWRILFTFVVQVLGGNYSSTEQVNSIQQLFAYCLLTGTKDESFGSSPTILSNSNFSKDPSKVTPIELTDFMVDSQGPEAPESLPQKTKKPKSKNTPSETKVTPPLKPTEGSEQSHSVSSGTVPDPQDPERNIQLIGTGLPSTLGEGTRKSQPLPEGTTTDPKDSVGNVQPADKRLPSTASNEVDETQSTRLRYQTLTENKGKASSEVEPDPETLPLTTLTDIQAYLLSKDELAQESDEEEVFAAGDDMEEDTQADEEEHQSPSPNKDKPEPSHFPETQVSDSDSSSPNLKRFDNTLPLTERQLVKYLRKVFRVLFHRINEEQLAHHEDAVVSYADLRASIKGYYEENIDHREHSDKRDAVKDDLALNKKVIEATEAYTKNSSTLTELLSLVKNFDFQGLNFSVESLQTAALRQDEHLASWAKSSNSLAWNLGLRMTIVESSQAEIRSKISSLKQDTSEIKHLLSPKGEHVATEDDKVEEEPTREVALIKSSSKPPITDPILEIPVPQREGKAIATDDQPDV
ncbi:hypothetical protein Tco_1243287 [Tanacetum coccineum]